MAISGMPIAIWSDWISVTPTGRAKICVSTPGLRVHRSTWIIPQATRSRSAPTRIPNPAMKIELIRSVGSPITVSTPT
ncbi:hypothetical protein ACFQX6_51475 [Streptosporangium lutulentum]